MARKHDTFDTWKRRRDIPLAIIAWLVVIAIIFWVLSHISRSLLLLVIAAFFAYALLPAVTLLQRFVPRAIAIIIVYLLVLLALGTIVYFVAVSAIEQFTLLAGNVYSLLTPKSNSASPLVITLQNLGITSAEINGLRGQITNQAEQLTSSIVPFLSSIFSFVVDILLVAVISIYFLVDGARIVHWLQLNTPISQQKRLHFSLRTIDRIVGGYIRGQILLAALIGVLVGVGMAIIGVPYATLLGVLTFILEFIPILGTFISGAFAILLALTHGWVIALIALIYFVFIHVIEGDIVGPRIVGKVLGLHPLVSIIALLIGTELYGIVGALFASPIAGVIQAILIAVWSEWKAAHPKSFSRSKKKLVDKGKNIWL